MVHGIDMDTSVLSLDVNFANELSLSGKIYVDATFKVVPRIDNAKQLLNLMAEKLNHVSFFFFNFDKISS